MFYGEAFGALLPTIWAVAGKTMEIVFGILCLCFVFIGVVIYGKAKGAPEPLEMTDEDIAYRISTESAWVSKFYRLPKKSESLKRMYEEKTKYIERLNAELESRHPQVATSAVAEELEPIILKAQELSTAGTSKAEAIATALREWADDVSEDSASSKENASDLEKRRYVIHAGVGLPECSIGMPAGVFEKLFGGEYREFPASKNSPIYISSKKNGVDAALTDGNIGTIFFHFSSPKYRDFAGETDRGVGKNSSAEDVIQSYGEPEEIDELYDQDEIEESGEQETSLIYDSLGIEFNFKNDNLTDIRCYKSRE